MQYPTIAQPQYGFAPTMPMMPSMSDMPPGMMNPNMSGMMGQNMPQMNFQEGGLASLSLPEMAERVQDAGRRGDTMLAHINPEEAGILQLLGGSGTINPETGQPEYFRKAFRRITRSPIFRTIAPMLPFLIPVLGAGIAALGAKAGIASALVSKAIASGVIGGFTGPKSGFDPKRALITGGTAFAGGKLMEAASGASGVSGASGSPGTVGGGGPGGIEFATAPGDAASVLSSGADVATAAAANPAMNLAPAATVPSYSGGFEDVGFVPQNATPSAAMSGAPPAPVAPSGIDSLRIDEMASASGGSGASNINPALGGPPAEIVTAANIPTSASQGMAPDQMMASRAAENVGLPSTIAGTVGEAGKAAFNLAAQNPKTTYMLATQGYAAIQAKKELDKQKAEAEKVIAAQEKHTQEEIAFAQDVLRRYPVEYRRLTEEDVKSQNLAGGGLAGLNAFKAGGRPRFLKGGGDGMSDDIPAMIGKKQKAALSDGEFVIPADVVSHLGNGSSRAGAKKLYAMMDNIRQARTGKKRQAPEVKPDRYMPA